MDAAPDREEKMPAAAPELIGPPPVYRIDEDGGDLVIRIPSAVVTRERLERFLDWLTQEDVAGLARQVKHAVRERLDRHAGSASSAAAAAAGEKADEPGLGPKGQEGVDDQLEHLYFMSRVERGLRQIDAGRFVSHEEAKRRFGR